MRYKFIKLLSLLVFSSVFAVGDLSKENIYIDKVDETENVEKMEKIKNDYFKKNSDEIKKQIDNIKAKSEKDEFRLKEKFGNKMVDKESKKKGKEIMKGLKEDENVKRWIKEFTKNIYYKELYKGEVYKGKKNNDVESQIIENYNKVISGELPILSSFDKVLSSDERIYIFLSSSVPDSVWKNYVKSVRMIGSSKIYLVLRGCVGPEGCKKIMPTINYIRKIAFDESNAGMDTSKPANVIIDPYLFRYYKVKVVPTLVYAKGVSLVHPGSEGFSGNLEKEINDYYKLEGDVSLFYFVNKLINEKKLKSEGLKKIKEIGFGL